MIYNDNPAEVPELQCRDLLLGGEALVVGLVVDAEHEALEDDLLDAEEEIVVGVQYTPRVLQQ